MEPIVSLVSSGLRSKREARESEAGGDVVGGGVTRRKEGCHEGWDRGRDQIRVAGRWPKAAVIKAPQKKRNTRFPSAAADCVALDLSLNGDRETPKLRESLCLTLWGRG